VGGRSARLDREPLVKRLQAVSQVISGCGVDGSAQFAVDVVGQFTEPPRLARASRRADAFPKISVICPIFKPDYLAEMIDSIQRQTWLNWS